MSGLEAKNGLTSIKDPRLRCQKEERDIFYIQVSLTANAGFYA